MKTSGKVLAEQVKKIEESKVFSIRSPNLPTWCPGCGYFGIHQGLNHAIQRLGLPHHKIVVVSGIGCAGRYPFFTDTYGLHTVHGRTLPVSTGVKLANPDLTVFAVGGDGDFMRALAGGDASGVDDGEGVVFLLEHKQGGRGKVRGNETEAEEQRSQRRAERNKHQIVEIAKNRDRIRDQIDRAEGVGDDERRDAELEKAGARRRETT